MESVIGRSITGSEDVLENFTKTGHKSMPFYTIKKALGEDTAGVVYTVLDSDLKKTDTYESLGYKKILVTLRSGKKAITYIEV